MADEKYNPSIDLLEKGAESVSSDRARRINSLHRSVSDITREQNRKRLQQSVEISALTKHQQKMMQELELERDSFMSETTNAHSGILKNLSRTIYKLSEGVASITKNTATATVSAIHQYGKAIGEDISINKTNTIAMALSRATPLFGFFAAKFMETDVFQSAARKIKEKVGSAFHQGLSSVGEYFRKDKRPKGEDGDNGTVAELKALRESFDREGIPHLQKGGYVNKGGIVEVHAAEVVTPVDKLLKHIKDAQSADIAEKLDSTLQIMSQDMMRMETIVVQREKATTNILETFMKEFKEAKEYEEEGFQQRLLKGVLELKVALVGMTSRFDIAWQRALLQHPAIAKMLVITDLMKTVMVSPLKFLFSRRGGYSGEVQKATATNNVFLKITNVLGLMYTGMMPRLDNIVKYTHIMAEAITKTKVGAAEGAPEYTMFHRIKEFFSKKKKKGKGGGTGGGLFDSAIDWMGLDRDALKEAGIKDFSSFTQPSKILNKMGITKKSAKSKLWDEPVAFLKDISSNIFKLTKMKKAQEKREGPHSPSMVQNIATTAKASEEQVSHSKGILKGIKNLGMDIWDIMLFLGSTLVNAITSAASMVGNLLGGALNLLGMGGMVKGAKGLIGGIGRKGSVMARRKMGRKARMAGGKATSGISKTAGKATGFLKSGAARGGSKLGKIALGGAKIGGAMLGGAIALGEMGWDAASVMMNPEGYVQSRIVSAFGAFLGGRDSGTGGALSGAFKGGAIGATIGSIVPGFGTAIGGAIGAGVGSILGFIGGKNLSKALEAALKPLKTAAKIWWSVITFPVKVLKEATGGAIKEVAWLLKSVTNILTFPFKVMKEGLKSIWIIGKFLIKKFTGIKTSSDFIVKPFIKLMNMIDTILKSLFNANIFKKVKKIAVQATQIVLFPFVGMIKAMRWVKDFIQSKLSKMPVIGPIFTKAFEIIKDINEGNLSKKLEEALEGKKNPLAEQESTKGDIKDIQTQMNEDIANGVKENILGIATRKSVFDSSMTIEKYNQMTKELADTINKNGTNTAKAINVNAQTVATSITTNSSNSSSNNQGQSGGGNGYFMGKEAVVDMAFCNQS